MISKDLLREIAVKCELETIGNLLLTCKDFNTKIDNKFFWINKLIKDFKFNLTENNLSYKNYYVKINKTIKNIEFIDKNTIITRLNLEDFFKLKELDETIIDIMLNTENKCINTISKILDLVDEIGEIQNKKSITIYLYKSIFPRCVKNLNYKSFWIKVLDKLISIKSFLPDLYDEKIEFYKNLTL